jgi:hypothetical protein
MYKEYHIMNIACIAWPRVDAWILARIRTNPFRMFEIEEPHPSEPKGTHGQTK